ncbi:putative bifunctional diguanylate cyclase/phosphodiesterase [Noviherbaspirillum autotrophicum]|uniref:Response regulator receiver protein n=1 Tax=Noviherbaspirillum autotrophicum TaxID=709839 RepID=A0A0C2BPM2_9BURK|nr:GGDEF domain-containing phosphodiesterase [Noviherbaspirillum autotrophicum]KIF79986.1 response regulator receiver protein [Noviherbaspirillum autotrophicum]
MQPEDEPLNFLDAEPEPTDAAGAPWKLLIVDDDAEVHEATRFAFHNLRIAGRPLQLINARSAAEAAAILEAEPEVAVILLDVVMESPNAGLDLVQRIRHEFGLTDVRIILRTGQPGHAPELKVIRDYDINDYKTKAELTHTRLVTALIAAIRSYDQLRTISDNRRGLELIVTATPSLMQAQEIGSFANNALQLLMSLLHLRGEEGVCVQGSIAGNDSKLELPHVVAATDKIAAAVGRPLEQLDDPELVSTIRECLAHQAHCFTARHIALYLRGGRRQAVMLVRNNRPLTAVERQLLDIFAVNLLTCFGNVTLVERLNYIAYHDPLTRLPNRTCFIEELNKAAANAPKGHVVCMIDIDRFTDINNALGHAVADQLLIAMGKRIGLACPDCHLARIGADTFGLIGPEEQLSPDHLQALLQEPFAAGDQLLPISATIGLCRINGGESGHTLFNRADIAFTRARINPHGGPLYFSPDMEQHTHWRLEVLRQLRRDFHDGRLAVWFQPQVSLADDGVIGLEALARWPDTSGFTQPPGVFIPLAEESGLIVDIGAWVLDQSCAAFSRLAASGHAPRRFAVNVSMPQMRRPDFPERVVRTLAARGVPPSALELEITESQLLDEPQVVLRNLHALKQEGIQITIDDFGTGYSSLGYLRQLPIDCIKIDRSFVVEIDRGRGDLFAETIITLAHKLGAETVAEGVETAAQVRCLRNLGCDTVQGFLYGRPMPVDELAGWIEQRTRH